MDSSPFNPFYDKYIAGPVYRGQKRKRDEVEVVIPSSYPSQKRRKYREIPSSQPYVVQKQPSLKPEVKGMDTIVAQSAISSTGTNANIEALNLIQQGSGSYNRVGRKVTLKSIRIKGIAACDAQLTSGGWQGNALRCILVWDAQPSGATPVFSDIFGITDQSGNESSSWDDPPKYDTMARYKVLKDWTYDFNVQSNALANTNAVRMIQHIDCFLPLLNLQTVFSQANTPMTIADLQSGALYFITRAAATSAATTCLVDFNARLRYNDV